MLNFLFFLLNLSCLFFYFAFCSFFLFLLYYFEKLPHESKIRYKNNLIDLYFDFLYMFAFDIRTTPKGAFKESGIIIYEGPQGSGKTVSMIHDVMLLQHKYPKCKVIDNLNYVNSNQEMDHPNDLIEFTNGVFGVISAIDECGIWFNNRNFKDFGKESNMLQVIFENRKVRRLLLGTTQRFNLIDKNLRLQVSEVRSAFTFANCFTYYIRKIPNVDSEGTIVNYRFKGIKFFVHTKDLRNAYDTYHVIKKFKTE